MAAVDLKIESEEGYAWCYCTSVRSCINWCLHRPFRHTSCKFYIQL